MFRRLFVNQYGVMLPESQTSQCRSIVCRLLMQTQPHFWWIWSYVYPRQCQSPTRRQDAFVLLTLLLAQTRATGSQNCEGDVTCYLQMNKP